MICIDELRKFLQMDLMIRIFSRLIRTWLE